VDVLAVVDNRALGVWALGRPRHALDSGGLEAEDVVGAHQSSSSLVVLLLAPGGQAG